ncbi:MAG: YARHG domain-containing protein [Intestinibacter sp.]|uniref:YARHG domain-containing protein n=1 Tax=Intestinibacter sp. TaxID=1965304 RepID=UPI002A815CED|nr:YARHG domain-containing protein [Intestinibacter sp.]MDY4576055.1 YARHG domain-containing protein [Intestinibacter sp.]
MKICSGCGSQNKDDAIYCKDCCEKLDQVIQENKQKPKNIKKVNTKIIALLIGSIVLVILGMILSKDGIMYRYYVSKGNDQVQPWKAVEYYTEALKIDYNKELLDKMKDELLDSGSYSTSLLKSLKNVLTEDDFNNLSIDVYIKEAEKAFEAEDYESCAIYLKKAEGYGYNINNFIYLNKTIENDYEDEEDYSDEYDDDYIIADSDVRYLSRNELSKYTKTQLGYIRNEIFARHGYIFRNKEYSDYFGNKSWYVPDPDCTGTEADLNSVERANVELIQEMEGK